MAAIDPDKGLIRAVGLGALTASLINGVIGAGIYALPSALAASSGRYAALALIACGIAIGAVAICFAEGGSRIATSGGSTGYIEAAFGPLAGYVAGTLLWFGNAVGMGSVLAALADMIAPLMPQALRGVGRIAVIVGVIGTIALVNLRGAARMARFVSITTAVKLVPLVAFVIVGAFAARASGHAAPPAGPGIGRGLILALFAYTGMEGTLGASGEVAAPGRSIPRALGIAIPAVIAIYVSVQIIAQAILGPAIAGSAAPLVDAMAKVSPGLRLLTLAGAGLSMFGIVCSDNLGTPRVLFAFARHGYLPDALARVDARTHAPRNAILCYSALPAVIALSGTFAELAVLSTLLSIAIYIAACAAAWLLARKRIALNGTPLDFPWIGAAAAVGIVSMTSIMMLASRAELFGLAASIAVSVVFYLLTRRGLG